MTTTTTPDPRAAILVTGNDGLHGTVQPWPAGDGGRAATAEVVLADGRRVMVPAHLLQARPDGSYYLPLGPADVAAARTVTAGATGTDAATSVTYVDGPSVIPLVAEQLEIHKQRVETGRVRVTKTVEFEEQQVDVPLSKEEVTVERVTVDRFVTEPPPVRREGDVTIIPVMEEVLVVEKRLMVREELRLTVRRTETHEAQTVTTRKEVAHVERVPAAE